MSGQLSPTQSIGSHPALAHANTDAMRVKIKWSKVEPIEGNRNWTPIDQALSLCKSYHKKLSVSVNAGEGEDIPNWLWNAGAKGYTLTQSKHAGAKIPLRNDPVFLSKWGNFIRAFGARYDGQLAYVVMTGIGGVVEWYTAGGADASYMMSISPPNPPGTAQWIANGKAIIDAYAAAFPSTPFFGAVANPYGNNSGVAAEKTLIDWAANKYKGRFGIMTNTLSARSNLNFDPNSAINQYQLGQPTGFQMLWNTSLDCGQRAGYDGVHCDPNALDESLTNGANIGGEFVEVYEPDCSDSALQATITFHQAQYKSQP